LGPDADGHALARALGIGVDRAAEAVLRSHPPEADHEDASTFRVGGDRHRVLLAGQRQGRHQAGRHCVDDNGGCVVAGLRHVEPVAAAIQR
jgi:hypothetical protein